ncbi:MAG: hypothetical protein HY736_20960 [Verrucomicrobia bacterium]|nr:hypothetical protein [Verrucomicrobiota bacterium]
MQPILYAANRHTKAVRGHVVAFDTNTGERLAELPTEIHSYDLVLDPMGATLFVSNWASESVSVVDTGSRKVKATIKVGHNPDNMVLARDGRTGGTKGSPGWAEDTLPRMETESPITWRSVVRPCARLRRHRGCSPRSCFPGS